ncbi:MAG TPA: hypothetical protein VFO85_10675, partial [Vicinamibacteria bacterium]|nr:hypothetical protein [Vicinamibacteria bacterium]
MNREMAFAGTAAGVLAVIGVLCRGAAPALGRALALVVVLLAMDTPLLALLWHLVPSVSLLLPLGRLFFVLALAIGLLAATGLDALVAAAGRRPGPARQVAVLLGAAAVALNTVELLRYGRALNPPFHPRTKELLYPVTPLIAAAKTNARRSQGRVVAVENWTGLGISPVCLVAGQHLVFGLPALGGYDSVVPERALLLNYVASGALTVDQALQGPPRTSYMAHFRTDAMRFDLLPRLGVTTIVGPPIMDRTASWSRARSLGLERAYSASDGQVFTIPDAPGEAWIVPRAVLVDTPSDALRSFVDSEFDFRQQVILLRSE